MSFGFKRLNSRPCAQHYSRNDCNRSCATGLKVSVTRKLGKLLEQLSNYHVYKKDYGPIALVNKILAHERFIVFLTYLFTLYPNMQSKFFHHPQFSYNGLLNY